MNDNIIDSLHDETNLLGIGGTGVVCIDGLCFVLVKLDKPILKVGTGSLKIIPALIIVVVILDGHLVDLVLEEIDLVEEEDDGSLYEPPTIADRVKEGEGFDHSINVAILDQFLVVLAQGDQKDDCRDIFKAVDPLFPL